MNLLGIVPGALVDETNVRLAAGHRPITHHAVASTGVLEHRHPRATRTRIAFETLTDQLVGQVPAVVVRTHQIAIAEVRDTFNRPITQVADIEPAVGIAQQAVIEIILGQIIGIAQRALGHRGESTRVLDHI